MYSFYFLNFEYRYFRFLIFLKSSFLDFVFPWYCICQTCDWLYSSIFNLSFSSFLVDELAGIIVRVCTHSLFSRRMFHVVSNLVGSDWANAWSRVREVSTQLFWLHPGPAVESAAESLVNVAVTTFSTIITIFSDSWTWFLALHLSVCRLHTNESGLTVVVPETGLSLLLSPHRHARTSEVYLCVDTDVSLAAMFIGSALPRMARVLILLNLLQKLFQGSFYLAGSFNHFWFLDIIFWFCVEVVVVASAKSSISQVWLQRWVVPIEVSPKPMNWPQTHQTYKCYQVLHHLIW